MSYDQSQYGKRKHSYRDVADAILGSDSTSVWLKDAILALDKITVPEALQDCAVLLHVQKIRSEEYQLPETHKDKE
jgi:hypothetical protein